MGQVTIYLEDELENKVINAANSAKLSKSKWIANLVKEKTSNTWPQSVIDLKGTWKDFPSLEEIRKNIGVDYEREQL